MTAEQIVAQHTPALGAISDIQFIWWLGSISLFLGALAIVSKALDAIEARRQRRLAEREARERDEEYYQAALKAASEIGTSWPPPRAIKGGRS